MNLAKSSSSPFPIDAYPSLPTRALADKIVIDTGSLEESWRFERGTPAYCVPMTLTELKTVLDKTDRDRLPPGRVKLT